MLVKTHHVMLYTCYATFLVGMVAGAALAHSPLLWMAIIILTALAGGLMGYIATKKPRRKRLPAGRNVRLLR